MPRIDTSAEVRGCVPGIYRAQRVQLSLVVTRNCCIGMLSPFDERAEERCGEERHIAREHEHVVRVRLQQCGVQPPKRTRARDPISNHRDAFGPRPPSVARNNQNLRRQAAQQGQLRIENRSGTDEECALVGAAESPRPAAGKNGCCPGNDPLKHE